MPPPAILTQFTGADVQRYLRAICSAPTADFSPTNLLNTAILPDRAIDAIAGNDLHRQAGSCRRERVTEFGTEFPLWAMRVCQGQNQGAWVCSTIGAWSSPGSQAVITVERLDAEGIGGTYIGPLCGPNKNNPHSGDGNINYGSDRSWTKSSNGGGRKGFSFYGTENLADQNARLFRPNTDFSHASASLVGVGWRVEIIGWDPNYGGAGVGAGYHWTAATNQRIWEYSNPAGVPNDPVDDPSGSDPTGAVGNGGDLSSPDGRMAFGSVMYGSNATAATPWVNYFEGALAHCSYFVGAAADSIHLHKTTICTVVQASIDAAVV